MKQTLKPDLILYIIALLFISFFIWANFSELEEVTSGQGKVISASKVQEIQNLEGGIVKKILVSTGQRVNKDQLLIKLEDTKFLGDYEATKNQIKSLDETIQLLKDELNIMEPLIDKGGIPLVEIIRLKQRISAREAEYKALNGQMPNLKNKLDRTSIRSPMEGIINRILINTEGGVAKPGNSLLEIIPIDDELVIEVEISPSDIAYVIKNQKALIQLSAFDFSIYGSIEGKVLNVGADTIAKEDGSTWYLCLVSVPPDGLTTMSRNIDILPGMQATVNIVSGHKTILTYLLQPLTNIKNKAFRER